MPRMLWKEAVTGGTWDWGGRPKVMPGMLWEEAVTGGAGA